MKKNVQISVNKQRIRLAAIWPYFAQIWQLIYHVLKFEEFHSILPFFSLRD